MTTTFPHARSKRPGYNVKQVEDFLVKARAAYDRAEGSEPVTADIIRHTAFSMQKGGYSTAHVDAALERLEDAFAAREREEAFAARGNDAWLAEARETAQVITNRLGRPDGERFSRVNKLTQGYSVRDVDRFTEKLLRYFRDGWPIETDDVRTVVFRPQRGGYQESQVDVVLDAVVDVMLAVR
ncbi:DivIVA domain-containing protein [Agromyces atrinae]|uniref:DivIVA domain-containing protein n=1 Tax=Agromyces atrinae TaxID=592376 RepID=UPI001F575A7A|nr:DivIVA domain-containing protein [Agromyces atrinae]MCI2958150.1 DivIVA domain-containing protein [Agromyces atrinae]